MHAQAHRTVSVEEYVRTGLYVQAIGKLTVSRTHSSIHACKFIGLGEQRPYRSRSTSSVRCHSAMVVPSLYSSSLPLSSSSLSLFLPLFFYFSYHLLPHHFLFSPFSFLPFDHLNHTLNLTPISFILTLNLSLSYSLFRSYSYSLLLFLYSLTLSFYSPLLSIPIGPSIVWSLRMFR